MGAKISALGYYLPEKIVSNFDLSKMVETSDEWIKTRTGIKERRVAAQEESTSTLAINAVRDLLTKTNVNPLEIDLIIVATMMADSPFPSVACKVQDAIGAQNAGAFDISAACSGFVYALETANHFLKAPQYKKILIIGSEVFSKFLDWQDRSTCVLFGDGAAAAIIESSEDNYILGGILKADGSGKELLHMPAGGTEQPTTIETINNRGHFLKMKGLELFQEVIPIVCDAMYDTADINGVSLNEIDLIIPHQANVHIIEEISSILEIPFERFYLNLEKVGNTSAASIPLALIDAAKEGRIKSGDKIMLVGFGAGLTCAANIIEWCENCEF